MNELLEQRANVDNSNDAIPSDEKSASEQVPVSKRNLLKTRDDVAPLYFTVEDEVCTLEEGCRCSWADGQFRFEQLRERIEPWLTSLFQSEHLNLLVGSGLTRGVCQLAETGGAGMASSKFQIFGNDIETAARKAAQLAGRKEGNFEDRMRVAFDLLRTLELFMNPKAQKLRTELEGKLAAFVDDILKSEMGLLHSNKKVDAFNFLIAFLMSFASRTGNRDRLHIFTTNYDRLIEEAADLAGLRLIDRFVGILEPVFRASRMNVDFHYNPPGIRGEPRYLEGVARLTKLHGSLDWITDGSIIRRIGMPFGSSSITPFLEVRGMKGNLIDGLMIYPNSSKDQETACYPFVELFRDFSAAICRPNSCLVTYGYSFGDEHINRVIHDMMTIPSTHLVVMSYDDPLGRIETLYQNSSAVDQLSLIVGPDIANLQTMTKDFLPKSAIDFASQRMGKLLQERLFTSVEREKQKASEDLKDVVMP